MCIRRKCSNRHVKCSFNKINPKKLFKLFSNLFPPNCPPRHAELLPLNLFLFALEKQFSLQQPKMFPVKFLLSSKISKLILAQIVFLYTQNVVLTIQPKVCEIYFLSCGLKQEIIPALAGHLVITALGSLVCCRSCKKANNCEYRPDSKESG